MHIHDPRGDGIFSGVGIEWWWNQGTLHGWLLPGSRQAGWLYGEYSIARMAYAAGYEAGELVRLPRTT